MHALHSYFAVGQATQVRIDGLTGLRYQDRHAADSAVQHAPLARDPVWARRIAIDTQGSQSVVVWNPGSAAARTMADVPDAAWQDFFCIEAANAGPDAIELVPGAAHQLTQEISIIS